MDCITSAAENYRISCLEAKAKCICCHIRSGFVDDSDNAKRYAFLSDTKSVRSCLHAKYFSDWIIQCSNFTQTFCHIFNSLFRQCQSVDQRLFHALIFRSFDILCILL